MEDFPQNFIDYFDLPNGGSQLTLTKSLSNPCTFTELEKAAHFVCHSRKLSLFYSREMTVLCRIALFHTRDASFTVHVSSTFERLFVNEL